MNGSATSLSFEVTVGDSRVSSTFELKKGEGKAIVVGRGPQSDVVVSHPGASGKHLELRLSDSPRLQLVACDTSTNGSTLEVPATKQLEALPKNTPVAVASGCRIQLPRKLKDKQDHLWITVRIKGADAGIDSPLQPLSLAPGDVKKLLEERPEPGGQAKNGAASGGVNGVAKEKGEDPQEAATKKKGKKKQKKKPRSSSAGSPPKQVKEQPKDRSKSRDASASRGRKAAACSKSRSKQRVARKDRSESVPPPPPPPPASDSKDKKNKKVRKDKSSESSSPPAQKEKRKKKKSLSRSKSPRSASRRRQPSQKRKRSRSRRRSPSQRSRKRSRSESRRRRSRSRRRSPSRRRSRSRKRARSRSRRPRRSASRSRRRDGQRRDDRRGDRRSSRDRRRDNDGSPRRGGCIGYARKGGSGKGADASNGDAGGKGSADGVRPGDWTCPKCGINVFGSKPACFKCHVDREGNPVADAKGGGKGGPGSGPPPGKFSEELWEAPRAQAGLQLLGETVPHINWTYVLRDDSRRSFAGYLRSPFSQEQTKLFYQLVHDGTEWCQPEGPQGPIPRKTAWMVAEPCTCVYRYGSIEVKPQTYPTWMIQIMQAVMPQCGLVESSQWPTCCNLNLYQDGGMSVGWHSDDERLFQGKFQDIRIISLSLGTARSFEVRANWPAEGENPLVKMKLGDGDLATMEGMLQKHFQHRVPREGHVQGPRINLTWRWVVKHNPQCPASRRR